MKQFDPRILELCKRVTNKRPRTVIDHLLKHGSITNDDLQQVYGYDHPPRAIRDVREHGIPLETFKVVSNRTGRKIAAYRFGDPGAIKDGRIGGRVAFSKKFRDALLEKYESRNTITGERMEGRYLQIDHRVPYGIVGDMAHDETDLDAYMLLDASSQRAKSWSCEHCKNWADLNDPSICQTCFWAFPERYDHVAMKHERRAHLVWQEGEVADYEALRKLAQKSGKSLDALLKAAASKLLSGE